MNNVIIIEKEMDLAEVIASYLAAFDIRASICSSPDSVQRQNKNPQAIIIDWNSIQIDYSRWLSVLKKFADNTYCIWTFTNDEDENKPPKIFFEQEFLLKPFELDILVKKLALDR